MDSRIMHVIGIDPSTVATGVVLLSIDTARFRARAGVVVNRQHTMIGVSKESTLFERFRRIRQARQELALFLAGCPQIDAVAYENPFIRDADATAALFQAIGAYLTLGAFENVPIYHIATNTVKAQQGLVQMSRAKAEKVRGGQDAKIRAIKAAAVEWANARVTFPRDLETAQDAIADAAAVGLVGFQRWQDEQYLKEQAAARQGTLALRRSPQTKK